MPCSSNGEDAYYRERANNEFAKASLCAVLTALSLRGRLNVVLEDIDWKEAGLSKDDLFRWWEAHQVADQQRRLREKSDAERKQMQQEALAKLTDDERRILGLK